MINMLMVAVASDPTGIENTINLVNKYSNILTLVAVLIPVLVFATFKTFKDKLLSNTSKVEEVDSSVIEQLPATDLIEIDNIEHEMFIDSYSELYTSVLDTKGIPFSTLSYNEKMSVNRGYITFLNSVNFNFSKHIMSRKIDIEATENIYMKSVDKLKEKHESLLNEYLEIKEYIEKTDDKSFIVKLNKTAKKIKLVENDLIYMADQVKYLEQTTSNIQGTSKSVYYSVSAELDEEAKKGLSEDELIHAYKSNVKDKANAMSNSLRSIGVESKILQDIELLDLARTHYKPFTSSVFKTKHLVEKTSLEKDHNTNLSLYSRIKIVENSMKEGESNV